MKLIEDAVKAGRKTLSEYESKLVLKEYGVNVSPEIQVYDIDGLKQAAEEIGFPLVLKGCSSELAHKTEKNMIRLDIRNIDEAVNAFEELVKNLTARDAGVLVQKMIKGRRELMAGMTRDPQFGACVMFGLGGIFTEILRDVSFRIAPLDKMDALEMMKEIRGAKILEGVRGMDAADLDQLADILIAVGKIGCDNRDIMEIDINPIIISGSESIAVDALMVLKSETAIEAA